MKKLFKGLGLGLLSLALVVGVGAQSAGATLTVAATSVTTDGAFTVTSVAGTTANLFAANTTGSINIGGTSQTSGVTAILGGTGTGVLGGTTSGIALTPGAAGTINIGAAAGIGAITVGASTGVGQTVNIGSGATTGSDIVNIGTGTATTRKTVNIATEAISTTNIGTGNFVNTIHIGDNASPVNLITIGGAASSLALADADWSVTSPGVATFVNALVTANVDTGLDVAAAGALSIGNTTATSVSICNDAPNCDSVLIATEADGGTITIGNASNTAVSIIEDNWGVTVGGAATFVTVNGNTVTTGTGTLTLAAGSSLITSGAFAATLTSTATTNATLPAGTSTLYGTLTGSITSANLLGSVSDETGTGLAVFATTPTLTTPVLGVATGTSLATSAQNIFTAVAATAPVVARSATATDDDLRLLPKTAGAARFAGIITSADLTADRTWSLPDTDLTITGSTGTGLLVQATSPTLVTPALGTPSALVLTSATGLPAASVLAGSFGAGAFVISTSLQSATIELGHATDTTLSRVSAGLIAVEGLNVVDVSTAQTLSNKTFVAPALGVATGTSLALGGGTVITQVKVYAPTLTPAATAATIQTVEQTFTVTGLTTADKVFVNGPAPTALCAATTFRVSAADTLAIGFSVLTAAACTPVAGAYNIVAVRS